MVSCPYDHAVLRFYKLYMPTGLFGNPVNIDGLLAHQDLFKGCGCRRHPGDCTAGKYHPGFGSKVPILRASPIVSSLS